MIDVTCQSLFSFRLPLPPVGRWLSFGKSQHIIHNLERNCQEGYEHVREDILTIREVAEYLKVTEKTVYGLARKRKLPCFKVSRHAKEKF